MTIAEVLRETIDEWPQVPDETYWTLVALPFVTLAVCFAWLRLVWPGPEAAPKDFTPATLAIRSGHVFSEETHLHPWQNASSRVYSSIENGHGTSNGNGLSMKEQGSIINGNDTSPNGKNGLTIGNGVGSDTSTRTDSLSGSNSGGRLLEAGEVAGDYSQDWKSTFDMTLLVVTALWLMVNLGLTAWMKPTLFSRGEFWLLQIPKLVCMIVVSVMAGLLCRHFCPTDSTGYIVTSKNSWFKVNYTRKVQHFAAYLVPLLFTPSKDCDCAGTLELSWGVWVTLIGFLVMIKPVREAVPMFMLQFNGLDRPEDRPNTLEWIIKYNIWPGELMIVFFAHLFAPDGQRDLVYILVFVTGVGDGLAEPVGIWLGKHKYMARSCDAGTYYQRSFEGSCCVFIVTVVTVSMVYTSFATFWQFLVALLTLPLALTLAEAFSPHTMDTPFIMGLGGAMLFSIITLL